MNPFLELWWLIRHGRGWRDVIHTMSHPRLGELRYHGKRWRPGGSDNGYWKLQPPGFSEPFGVWFQSEGRMPTPEGLAQVETIIADLDGLFERMRPAVTELYETVVQEPMPHDWRTSFKLAHIELPDEEDPERKWQVTYWCEAALHWVAVDFAGDEVIEAEIEG